MRTVLAILAMLAVSPAAEAGLTVCNKTPHATRVALGRFDGATWSSAGWWSIAPKSCDMLIGGTLDSRYYYLYATDGGSGSWDGRFSFCVGNADKFAIRGRADCEGHGFDRKGFFEIDTGQAANYTQTLAD